MHHHPPAKAVRILAGSLLFLALIDPCLAQMAQKSPFGLGGYAPNAGAATGITAWLLEKQAEFTRAMIAGIRLAGQSWGGLFTLCGIAFTYGVLHAAGPGHGKAVVASYVLANNRVLRRAVGISFLAAFIQAMIAILIVLTAVLVLGATARQIDASVNWIEILSFGAIVLLGLGLARRKALKLHQIITVEWKKADLPEKPASDIALPESTHLTAPDCPVCGAGLRYGDPVSPALACTHVHLPDADVVAKAGTWREILFAAFAAGSRPCSGALILLAFALSQSAVIAGIAAVCAMALGTAITTSGFALAAAFARQAIEKLTARTDRLNFALAVMELLAALAIIAIGSALLLGYLSGS